MVGKKEQESTGPTLLIETITTLPQGKHGLMSLWEALAQASAQKTFSWLQTNAICCVSILQLEVNGFWTVNFTVVRHLANTGFSKKFCTTKKLLHKKMQGAKWSRGRGNDNVNVCPTYSRFLGMGQLLCTTNIPPVSVVQLNPRNGSLILPPCAYTLWDSLLLNSNILFFP